MTHKPFTLVCALLLLSVLATAPVATAEDDFDLSLSVYGGWVMTETSDVGVKQPSPFIDGETDGVELGDDLTFGGKLTGWWGTPGFAQRIDFALELDFTRFTTDMPAQTVSAEGITGSGVLGAITFPLPFDIQSNNLAVNLLWRYPFRVSESLPSGRWYPYFGAGGGVSFSRMRQSTGPWRYDASPMFEVLAGVKVFVTRHLGLFGEFKRTQTSHDFEFSGFTLDVPLAANHFVGGVAIHF